MDRSLFQPDSRVVKYRKKIGSWSPHPGVPKKCKDRVREKEDIHEFQP
jgi:hypothetical protein